MKIIDLKKFSGPFVEKQISEYCGGKDNNRGIFGNHVTGLLYHDPSYGIKGPTHKVAISFFKSGLGLYFRNLENNRMILLKYPHIKSVEILKQPDIVRPYDYSMFSALMKWGVSYHHAKNFLMPKEIIVENLGTCTIVTEDHIFKFVIKKMNSTKVGQIFNQSGLKGVLNISVEPPKIINSNYVINR